MNVAILCKPPFQAALATAAYFRERGRKVGLLVVETSWPKQYPESRRKKAAVWRQFSTSANKTPSHVLRKAGALLPKPIKTTMRLARTQARCLNLKRRARKMSLPVRFVKKHSSWETRRLLEEYAIRYALLLSSGWLIKEPLLSMEHTRIINVHPAKLPEHRSLDSLPWSVVGNDPIGATAHLVDAGVDTGPILFFQEIPPLPGDTLVSLRKRIFEQKPAIFYRAVHGLKDGTISPEPQKESEGAHHRPMTLEEMMEAERALRQRIAALRCRRD